MASCTTTRLDHLLHTLTIRIRGITRDESIYPDPESFKPERWLSPKYPTTYREPLTQFPNLAGYSQFGFGRRTCQGVPIVEQDLFLTMGGLAWAFSIQKKRDPKTGEVVPVHWNNFTPLLIAKPVKFDFDAVPRGGEAKVALLRQMYEASKQEDEEIVEEGNGMLRHVVRRKVDKADDSDSDHDVLINVRESSAEPSDDGKDA